MQRTNIYLEERQLRTLKHIAAEKRESVATIVREAVDAYLDQQRVENQAWMETLDDLQQSIREHSSGITPDEIEAEITAAREEVREIRRTRHAADRRSPSPEDIAEFCRRHHIRWLAVFGSILRDDFGPNSDVDVLVEFEEGKTPGLAFIDIQDDLSALFDGRPVDLGTRRALNRRIRDRVLAEARVLYDAA